MIADGVHLHDIAIRLAARAAGPGRLVLVSDAMAAAGMPDGRYQLGSKRVTVAGGVARLLRRPGPSDPRRARSPAPPPPWPTWSGTRSPRACPSPTWPPPRAPPRPACWASADRTGALRPGLAADLVVCDDDFRPRAVMRHGEWLAAP